MAWYCEEYAKVFGRKPHYQDWWRKDDFAGFKEHFVFKEAGPFAAFQAKFNLLIALNPAQAQALTLTQMVLDRDKELNAFREYRTFLPPTLTGSALDDYATSMLRLFQTYATQTFRPRMAFSIAREPRLAQQTFDWLAEVCGRQPWTDEFITGIDFCGDEFYHPPKRQTSLLAAIPRTGRRCSKPWQVAYHVGEMWDHISLASSARWVMEACQYGIKRIGHGMALGVEPGILLGKTTTEPVSEFKDHKAWLEAHQTHLAELGYPLALQTAYQTLVSRNIVDDTLYIHWTMELCNNVRTFQEALLTWVRSYEPVIEVCPTSNLRIGQLTSLEFHPLPRFLRHGLKVTISTDDPGILDISLADEEKLLLQQFRVTPEILDDMERAAHETFV